TRMASQAGPPVLVPHITNIKIAAAVRRDVYRRRPTHEQAYWLQRIRTSHDPEAEMRAACAADYVYASPDHGSHAATLDDLDANLYGKHRLRRTWARVRNGSLPPPSAEDLLRRLRRYKGV